MVWPLMVDLAALQEDCDAALVSVHLRDGIILVSVMLRDGIILVSGTLRDGIMLWDGNLITTVARPVQHHCNPQRP